MKKKILVVVLLLISILVFSCREPIDGGTGGGGGSTDFGEEITGTIAMHSSSIDFEKSIMDEVNLVRKNPKKYFQDYIENKNDWYEGTPFEHQMQNFNQHEGYASLKTDMYAIDKQVGSGDLVWAEGLFKFCNDHSSTQGPAGATGHDRTNGKSWQVALESQNYGTHQGAGENLAYGEYTCNRARTTVICLLLDDEVSSRGHRKNILNESWTHFGASVFNHEGFTYMCCMNFATNWADK